MLPSRVYFNPTPPEAETKLPGAEEDRFYEERHAAPQIESQTECHVYSFSRTGLTSPLWDSFLVNLARLKTLKRFNRPWYERHRDLTLTLIRFLPQGFFAVHGKRNINQRFTGHFQQAQSVILKVFDCHQLVRFSALSVLNMLKPEKLPRITGFCGKLPSSDRRRKPQERFAAVQNPTQSLWEAGKAVRGDSAPLRA